MKTREKIIEQIDLQEEIQKKAQINIVNCGSCGSVLLHRINDEDIECPYCNFISEPSDFPDFFYRGLENSLEFNNESNSIY